MGTVAYHIEAALATATIEGVLQVPGSLKDGSSHRSKLGSLSRIVTVVEAIIKLFGITTSTIRVGCDGEAQLCKLLISSTTSTPKQTNFDCFPPCRNECKPARSVGSSDIY
jgi:hypothetical protein